MKLEKLSSALELLVDERKILNKDIYSFSEYDELTNIIVEILDSAYQMVGMKGIEAKVTLEMKIDTETLEKGLNIIENANPIAIDLQSNEKTIRIDPSEILQEFKDFIEKIKTKTVDRINALFGLELFYDSNFDRLMMTFDPNNQVFSSIQFLLRSKLENIKNDEILLLWARMKSCFGNDEQNRGFPIYDDIIPDNFFSSENTTFDVREKCAIVIAKYRPLTVKKMVEEGATNIPIILPGIARILAISNTSEISQISSLEILLIRSTSQIIALHNLITRKESSDIARAIGADPNGLVFDGEFVKEYKNNISKNNDRKIDKNKLLVLNIKRLAEYTALFTKQQIQIETALRQYKMGQEVISPSRKSEFDDAQGSLEIYLQKDMCKFLIERNILAFGKSIGRNQIDLYYKEISSEDFVIEAKVYKDKKNITKNALKENLVQLQSYMDLHDQARGILAIYNFTNTLMMAPKKWLKGRILILCINLCDLTASGRKASIEVVESEISIIDLIEIDKS